MKLGAFILFLPFAALAFIQGNSDLPFRMVNAGFLGSANFNDGVNYLVTGHTAPDGSFTEQPVAPAEFFEGTVFNLDTNSFSVINGTVYSKGLLNGGTYPSMSTNLNFVFAHFSFATNSRVIIGAVPSYKSAVLQGAFSSSGGMSPPIYPSLQISIDGGATWQTPTPVTVPALVSLYDGSSGVDGFTNLVVNSFVNPATQGQTNDLTGQVVFVSDAADNKSPVPLSQANNIAANATKYWAASPAVAAVNLNGNALVHSSRWQTVTRNSQLVMQADGTDFATFTPAITGGAAPFINKISVTQSNVTFQVTASESPAFQFTTNLSPVAWATLTTTTNWSAAGYYFATANLQNTTNCFFRASVSGTNTAAAKVAMQAQFFATSLILTNAAGARFAVSVNATTNGLTFTPAP